MPQREKERGGKRKCVVEQGCTFSGKRKKEMDKFVRLAKRRARKCPHREREREWRGMVMACFLQRGGERGDVKTQHLNCAGPVQ
jgi:hypothetical protein